MTFEEAQKITDETRPKTAEIMEKIRNLAWKQSQQGCKTVERQKRIDELANQYREAERAERAMWRAVSASIGR